MDIRDGEFFVSELYRNLGEGTKLGEAFERACEQTAEYTSERSNGGEGDIPQHPHLDDNGDGVGTWGDLPQVVGQDGFRAKDMELGLDSNAPGSISWFSAKQSFTVSPVRSSDAFLYAETTTGRDPDPDDEAWIEIKTPAYTGGTVVDPDNPDSQQVVGMIGPILPGTQTDLGAGKVLYEWSRADIDTFWAQHSLDRT